MTLLEPEDREARFRRISDAVGEDLLRRPNIAPLDMADAEGRKQALVAVGRAFIPLPPAYGQRRSPASERQRAKEAWQKADRLFFEAARRAVIEDRHRCAEMVRASSPEAADVILALPDPPEWEAAK